MTRIALLIVLSVSLVVGGISFYQVQTDDTPPTAQRIEATGETHLGHGETTAEAQGKSDATEETASPQDTIATTATPIDPEVSRATEAGSNSSPTTAQATATTTAPTTTAPTTTAPTTTAPTTTAPTTTATGPLVIPVTISYPRGLHDGEGYEFRTFCGDVVERDGEVTFECPVDTEGGRGMATLEYFGHGMPYLYSESVPGNHDHAWWVAGDREGYRCAYGFMYDKHPNPFGMFDEPRAAEFIARATIVQPIGAAYGAVNDGGMDEAIRYYDGSLTGKTSGEIVEEDCQATALDDFDYDSYVPQGPDSIRVGLFRGDGEIGDIRDFTQIDVGPMPGHFEFIEFDGKRVTIVFILEAKQQVSHVFYYDTLGSGRIAVEVNGKLLQ